VEPSTKGQILNAAKDEFARVGFSGARMDSIAKNAGVNKAMIHYYFSTKEQLYESVIERLSEEIHASDSLVNSIIEMDLPVQDRLNAILYFFVKQHFQCFDEDMIRIIHWEKLEKGTFSAFPARLMMGMGKLTILIKEGISIKVFETLHPELVVMQFVSSLLFYLSTTSTASIKHVLPQYEWESFYDFLKTSVFKTLAVAEKIPELSAIPEGLIQMIDQFLSRNKTEIPEGSP